MSLAIRLKQVGTKNKKKWRIVVTDRSAPRNGRQNEEIGSYNSLIEPPAVVIKLDRYDAWVKKGAQPTAVVKQLVEKQKKKK